MTQEIKRNIRKRDSLYDKYKRLRRPSERYAFVEARHLVKHKLKQAHNRYIGDILGLTDTSEQAEPHNQSSSETHKGTYASKKLFSLLKNSKQESKGTAPLKKDGKLYSDTVDKANILNSQFQSVFTPKSPLKLSQLAYMSVQDLSDRGVIDPSQVQGESLSSTPHMESISISVNGIAKLLKDLNPHKAAGPDQIKPLVLQSQFQSVFTPKSPLKLSQLAYMSVQDLSDRGVIDPSQVQGESLSSTPHMESISISVNGIAKLLKDLNPHKAAGPDQIKPLVLQRLRDTIAPVLQVIFQRSLDTGREP